MNRLRTLLAAVALAVCGATARPVAAIVVDMVPVLNAGNGGDGSSRGAVAQAYAIGRYEVTNAQYTAFLNVVDPTGGNALALYNSSMSSDAKGGIDFTSGAANGSKYAVKSGRGANPVVFVTWYDAVRFTNWLHNGQTAGGTETGAYTLLGGTATPSNGSTVSRESTAIFFLPNENEWYKAAFHKNDGVTANYFDFAMSTDGPIYSDQPPGTSSPNAARAGNFNEDDGSANGYNDGFAVTGSTSNDSGTNYLTNVGAYTSAGSPYGTFDQGGNVSEWIENALIGNRRAGGGNWNNPSANLSTANVFNTALTPSTQINQLGFRVASIISIVPETSSVVMLGAVGMLGAVFTQRRAIFRALRRYLTAA